MECKTLAEFDYNSDESDDDNPTPINEKPVVPTLDSSKKRVNLGLNYTINLVLPKTDDPAIYNAIFKSLKENLLND